MHIGLNSSADAKSEIQQNVWKADGLVESTILSQKIKAISEGLRFKLSLVHN